MPTYNYPFSGGVNAIPGWGDRWNFLFGGTWINGDTWTVEVTSTTGDFTLGLGRLSKLNFTNNPSALLAVCFTYRDRVYLALGSQFNFSDNGDVTQWEEQGP